MSLIKRFQEDTEELKLRAAYAAWEPTSTLRMAAMTQIFQDCGTAAKVYADPVRVTQLLVSSVVREFMANRTRTTYKEAA